jgi:sulfopyruvate decarboxylase subunit alpha
MSKSEPGLRGEGMTWSLDNAKVMWSALKAAGIDFAAMLPDSWMAELERLILADSEITSVIVTREDEGIAICAGAQLGGKKPCMIMEGSGIGLSAGVLTRPCILQHIPLLILSSHVSGIGELAYYHWETRYMLEPVLQALRIPYHTLWDIKDAERVFKDAQLTVEGHRIPVAVLFPRNVIWEEVRK